MKTFLIVVMVIAAIPALLVALIAYGVYQMHRLTRAGTAFLNAAKHQDVDKVCAYLSDDFETCLDLQGLKESLSRSPIQQLKQVHWTGRQIDNNRGQLTGWLLTESGKTVPVRLLFARENGRWKVCSRQAARIPERFFEEELHPYFNVPPTLQSADRLLPTTARESTTIGVAPAGSPSLSNTTAENQPALLLDPIAVPAHDNLGSALHAKGDLDGAIAEFRAVLRSNPDDFLAHLNLGVALHAQGHLEDALAELRIALRLNPDYHETYYALAGVLEAAGQMSLALEHYRHASRLGPADPRPKAGIERIANKPPGASME